MIPNKPNTKYIKRYHMINSIDFSLENYYSHCSKKRQNYLESFETFMWQFSMHVIVALFLVTFNSVAGAYVILD